MASDMDKASLDHCAREGQESPDQTYLASSPSQLWECAPKLYKHTPGGSRRWGSPAHVSRGPCAEGLASSGEDFELNVCDGQGRALQAQVTDIPQEIVLAGRGRVLQAAEAGLQLLLLLLELQVGVREGVEDGRGREGHDEDATQDAAEGHHLARHAAGYHVSVAHRCHGDDGPPIGGRDASELQDPPRLILSHVDKRGEEGDGHAQEEEKQAELARAAAHREAQRLQPQRVARQAHHVEDAEGPQNAQRQPHLLQVRAPARPLAILLGLVGHSEGHVVRENGQDVYDVQGPLEELALVLGLDKPQAELEGKPGHADCLHDENVVAFLRALPLERRGNAG